MAIGIREIQVILLEKRLRDIPEWEKKNNVDMLGGNVYISTVFIHIYTVQRVRNYIFADMQKRNID